MRRQCHYIKVVSKFCKCEWTCSVASAEYVAWVHLDWCCFEQYLSSIMILVYQREETAQVIGAPETTWSSSQGKFHKAISEFRHWYSHPYHWFVWILMPWAKPDTQSIRLLLKLLLWLWSSNPQVLGQSWESWLFDITQTILRCTYLSLNCKMSV